MIFIGDVHGNWAEYRLLRNEFHCTCLLGDVGIGFPGETHWFPSFRLPFKPGHRMLRGNHDHPVQFQKHPAALPVWGYDKEMDFFWIGGGYSIDERSRTPGFDWWADEEISYLELWQQVIPRYQEVKPRFVASHECPSTATFDMFPHTRKREIRNRTREAMEQMFNAHQPEVWVFGHYHEKRIKPIGRTLFACCGCVWRGRLLNGHISEATFEIPGLEWSPRWLTKH